MVFGSLYDVFQLLLGVFSPSKSLDPSRAVQTGSLVFDLYYERGYTHTHRFPIWRYTSVVRIAMCAANPARPTRGLHFGYTIAVRKGCN